MVTLNIGPHIVERLEDQLQVAKDRIKELEQALGIGDDLMPYRMMGFSPHESAVVNVLFKRPVATKEQILQAMYGQEPERRWDIVGTKMADTVICITRKKLRRLGVAIETLGLGVGYQMPVADKAALGRLMDDKRHSTRAAAE